MKDYICSIDIGSTCCRVIVGRPDEGGRLEVIGVGVSPCRGVKQGSIVNIEATLQSISEAVREAELMSGLVVDEALVNLTGRSLRGDNSRGVIAITNRDRIVREADVLRVIEGAQNIRIPADQEIIHVLSRDFRVDDQEGVRDPVGMTGVRLEAEVHIVSAGITTLSNLNKAVSGSGITIRDGVMSSLASAEAVLSEGEKDLGVAVVDIGGGVADIILYFDGGVFYSSVVPLGGIHVTQDLSIGLKIPIDQAEKIKRSVGSAFADLVDPTERIELPGMHGRPSRWVLLQDVASIIEPRMREIYEFIDTELVRSGRKGQLAGGVILTGGSTLLHGAVDLAEEVFQLSATPGFPSEVTGFTDRVQSPEFATSIGLIEYARRLSGRENPGAMHHHQQPMRRGGLIDRMKKWIGENL